MKSNHIVNKILSQLLCVWLLRVGTYDPVVYTSTNSSAVDLFKISFPKSGDMNCCVTLNVEKGGSKGGGRMASAQSSGLPQCP